MSGTTPDSVSYPEQNYGILGPLPAYVINIQDIPGADPTGNDDSTGAIQTALDSLPDDGGEVIIAPGVYKITATLLTKSNTTISGPGTIKASPLAEWRGARYRGISNVNTALDVLTDANITVRGLTLDYTDLGHVDGLAHCIYFRYVQRVIVQNCTIINGASSVALLGCDDTQEIGNRYLDFVNCGSDHWTEPRNARVVGCHIETTNAAQMVNWNPERSDLVGTGLIADGFTFTGNVVISHEAAGTVCQIEALVSGNTVSNITISGNVFKNVWIAARGDIRTVVISNNTFSDFQGVNSVIYCSDRAGLYYPNGLIIVGNTILNPLTTSPAEAVIVAESPSAQVIGNTIMGVGYTTSSITSVGQNCQILANYIEMAPLPGRLQGGARVINGTENYWGWTDTNGTHPRMYLQTDNNWIWRSTGTAGVDRTVASLQALSSTSEMRWSIPQLFQSYTRSTPATVAAAGTTIGGATAMTADINNVTTATGGSAVGVMLQSLDGQRQTVINSTAVTINVYPNNNGAAQIDAGGVGVPATIAAGKSKTFTRVAASDFRTIAVT